MDWRDYERYIHKRLRTMYPRCDLRHDVKLEGKISEKKRQIDIYARGKVSGFDIDVVIDCKHFSKNVDIKVVESFLSLVRDVGASKGVIITNEGYTNGAEARARNDSHDVDLRIIEFDELAEYEGMHAFPFSGGHFVYLPAPHGWKIDSRRVIRRNETLRDTVAVCSLSPLGYEAREAFENSSYMYVNFWHKDSQIYTIDDLNRLQAYKMKNYYRMGINGSNIGEACTSVLEDREYEAQLRNIRFGDHTMESTLFVDFEDFILVIVLLSDITKELEYDNREVEKLIWIGERLKPGNVIYTSEQNLLVGHQ